MVELVPDEPRVFPVGRLDYDTEGLLLLTNDGELTQLLTHPSHGVVKTYLAEVEGVPAPATLAALREGVELDDGPTAPARVQVVQRARRRRPRSRSASTRAATARCAACARRSVIRCADWCARASGRCTTASSSPASGGRCAGGGAARSTRRRRRASANSPGGRERPGLTCVSRETPGAPRRDHLRRGHEGRDRRQDGAAGEGAASPATSSRHDDVVSIIFTATPDLTAEFPATAARAALGLDDVPLLGAQEQAVAARHAALHPGARALLLRPVPRRAAPRVPRGRAALRTDLPTTTDVRDRSGRSGVRRADRHRSHRRLGRARAAPRGRRRASASTTTRRGPRPPRPWARSTPLAADVADAVRRRRPRGRRGAGGPRRRGRARSARRGRGAGHRRRLGEGTGRRHGRRRRAPSSRRASSAVTRWRAPSRRASTAPSADLFVGATWVLTPTGRTDPQVFAAVRAWVAGFGAEAIAVAPELHDALVAVVSHVPQLAASTLMNVASAGNDEHAVMLRLAAGGFRDMTRIASSHPGDLARHLPRQPRRDRRRARRATSTAHRGCARSSPPATASDLLALLESARVARRNLPTGIPADTDAGRAAHPGARPRGRDRRGHRPWPRASASTSPTSRSPTRSRAAAVCSCWSSPSAGSTRSSTRCSSTATTCRGRRSREDLGVSVPTDLVLGGPHPLHGRLRVPGDKGISHRALLFAAMADGRSRVAGLGRWRRRVPHPPAPSRGWG